jgi:hypothetical protein
MIGEIILKGISTAFNHQGHNKAPSGHQLQEAEEVEASVEDLAPNQEGCFAYSVEKIRGMQQGHTKSRYRSKKEIAEAEAWQNQPKQVLHTTSCYSPYILEYVGNQQPTASVASTSHSQAAWAPLPPPPLMAPTSSHNQQPEGNRQVQQQRDAREKSLKLGQSTALYQSRDTFIEAIQGLNKKIHTYSM